MLKNFECDYMWINVNYLITSLFLGFRENIKTYSSEILVNCCQLYLTEENSIFNLKIMYEL